MQVTEEQDICLIKKRVRKMTFFQNMIKSSSTSAAGVLYLKVGRIFRPYSGIYHVRTKGTLVPSEFRAFDSLSSDGNSLLLMSNTWLVLRKK